MQNSSYCSLFSFHRDKSVNTSKRKMLTFNASLSVTPRSSDSRTNSTRRMNRMWL